MATSKASAKRTVNEITLIVPAAAPSATVDKAGGELHTGALARMLGYKKVTIKPDSISADLEKLSDTVYIIADTIEAKKSGSFRVASIEIGLAISGEGSIGIATAGVEASVTVTLERK